MQQRRPGFAAPVRRCLDRGADGLGDHAGKPVGRAVFGLDQRDVEDAEANRFAGRDGDEPIGGQAMTEADLHRRGAADQLCAGALGDHGGVHRVIEMGVQRQHSLQPIHAEAGQAAVDARQ